MKNFNPIYLKRFFFVPTLILSLLTGSLFALDKMKPEEVVAKHLESIGTAEARAALKSVTIVGTTKATFFGRGGGIAEGIAVLASQNEKYLVGMKFNNSEYPFEKMGYDGDEFTVGYVRPGARSVLGDFLRINDSVFKHGILGGTLSTSWELLNFNQENARLKYAGMEKINEKKHHELKYEIKKGSELSISLYFDPDTFRHIRTEYRRIIAARQGASIDSSARQSETRYKMVEDFSDFKEENELTLPHTYKIYLEILSGNGTTSYEWLMNLEKFTFNQSIDSKEFRVDSD